MNETSPLINTTIPPPLSNSLRFLPTHLHKPAIAVLAPLIILNLTIPILLLLLPLYYPKLASLSLIAYALGFRHAVDADHIAAIDNVQNRLIKSSTSSPPIPIPVPTLLTGLYFSLGHSSIVILLTLLVATTSKYYANNPSNTLETLKSDGEAIGTLFSATVLLFVGVANAILGYRLYSHPDPEDVAHKHIVSIDDSGNLEKNTSSATSSGGFVTRCCPSLFAAIDSPWKMFPIGVLFGMGFDTAVEVAVLALTALADNTRPICIMLLPLCFTSSMVLVDTLDGVLMLSIYGGAGWKNVPKVSERAERAVSEAPLLDVMRWS